MSRKLVSFDWALKKLLRSKANFAVLNGFLSELLKQDITIIEVLESESNKNNASAKFNRVDLKVKNGEGHIILIEVQHERQWDYLHRILYGTSQAIVEHLDEGKPYSDIVKVISVNIVYFDLGHGTDYVYHGTTRFEGLHTHDQLELNAQQKQRYACERIYDIFPEYYLLKVNQFDDLAKDTLDEWMYFLKNEKIQDNFKAKGLREAKQILDVLKLSDVDRASYEQYQQDLHQQASMTESSYGMGRFEGMAEGKAEGKLEVAASMLADGMSVEQVMRITKLSAEEIAPLLP